jgi:hypothetical protein
MKISSTIVRLLLVAGVAGLAGPLEAQTGFCPRDCLGAFLGCLKEGRCLLLGGCPGNVPCVNHRCRGTNDPCGRFPDGCGIDCDTLRGNCLEG